MQQTPNDLWYASKDFSNVIHLISRALQSRAECREAAEDARHLGDLDLARFFERCRQADLERIQESLLQLKKWWDDMERLQSSQQVLPVEEPRSPH